MAGSNQFKAFATGAGANVLTPAALAALSSLASGFSSGVASSQQLNTLWRQSSFVATAIAQAIADMTGAAVNDDGVIANFENQLLAMFQQEQYVLAAAGGTADALTANFTPAIATLVNGMALGVRASSANATTTPTFSPNGLTAHTIVKGNGLALAPGDIAGAGHWITLQWDATLGAWVLLNPATGVAAASAAPIQGAFKNLQVSATGTNATVTASADEIAVESASNAYTTLRNVSLSINSAASGANGLDTGTLAASTWYSVWVVWNGATASGLLSASSTAPTMPSGYTHKARVGWIRTDGTANKYPLGFSQFGKSVQYKLAAAGNLTALPQAASGVLAYWTAVAVGAFVPPTASKIKGNVFNGSTTAATSVAPNSSYSTSGASASASGGYGSLNVPSNGDAGCFPFDFLLESTNVYYGATGAASSLNISGWEDNL